MVIWGLFRPFLATFGKFGPQTQDCLYCPKWSRCLESDIWNHLHQISARLAIILRCHKTSLRQFCVRAQKWLLVAPKWHKMAWNDLNPLKLPPETISIGFLLLLRSFWVVTWLVYDNLVFKAKIGQKWPEMAEKGPKWPKLAWMSKKWHPKPSPLDFCFSCGHFEWSYDQFTSILSLEPNWPKNGRKRLQMTKNGLKIWKVTFKTISIGFLPLLRSFWVVTWLACDNFEFGAKIGQNGQKWPKKAPNDQKWPECLKNDWNWLIRCCHSA